MSASELNGSVSASELNGSVSASELNKSVSASELNGSVSASETSADVTAARPTLRVVRGDATPEEIAVLVALLGARSGGGPEPVTGRRPVSGWSAPGHSLRRQLAQGPGAWAASAWR